VPYKSKAQRRLFHAMAERGELLRSTVEHWENETKKQHKKLPEKVRRKK